MNRIFKFGILLTLFIVGCESKGNPESVPPGKAFPDAPEFTSVIQQHEKSLSGTHNYIHLKWTPVDGALGYKLLMAASVDSAFRTANGQPEDAGRWGVYFDQKDGIVYFRVVAMNAASETGDTSKAYPFYYNGFD